MNGGKEVRMTSKIKRRVEIKSGRDGERKGGEVVSIVTYSCVSLR